MVKQANPELLERLRALADPQRYKQQLVEARTNLIARAEQLLIERDLTESDSNMQTIERDVVIEQIDKALTSIDHRINEVDDSLAAFETGEQAGMNRAARRKLLSNKNLAKAAGASSLLRAVPPTVDENAGSENDSTGSDDQEEGV